MGLTPLGGMCEGGKVHRGRPSPWGTPLSAERSAGTDRGAGEAWTLLTRVHTCWLASNQGARLVLASATLLHYPARNTDQIGLLVHALTRH